MIYVALLRGVNVGGNGQIKMAELKMLFEGLRFKNVRTYINSGNVIFRSEPNDVDSMATRIEIAIAKKLDVKTKVLLRDLPAIKQVVDKIPKSWVNDQMMKCDVFFLGQTINSPAVVSKLPSNPYIEDVLYIDGTVIWCIDRDKVGRSRMFRLVGTEVYRNMTSRNPNTVRKIYQLMNDLDVAPGLTDG